MLIWTLSLQIYETMNFCCLSHQFVALPCNNLRKLTHWVSLASVWLFAHAASLPE